MKVLSIEDGKAGRNPPRPFRIPDWLSTILAVAVQLLFGLSIFGISLVAINVVQDVRALTEANRIQEHPMYGTATDAKVWVPYGHRRRILRTNGLQASVTTPLCQCTVRLLATSYDEDGLAWDAWNPAPPPYTGTFGVVVDGEDPDRAMALRDFTRVTSGTDLKRDRTVFIQFAAVAAVTLPFVIRVRRRLKRDRIRAQSTDRTGSRRRASGAGRTRH